MSELTVVSGVNGSCNITEMGVASTHKGRIRTSSNASESIVSPSSLNGITMMKSLLNFIPAKWKVRGEEKAKGEAQLALGGDSLAFWEQRLGWSSEAARYLATAFTFGVRENIATVLDKAQQLSGSEDFEEQFVKRLQEDPSIIGASLEASKFISAEELRDLIGRILVGDVGKPGSVSRRAVSVSQDLPAAVLEEFLKLRSVTWTSGEGSDRTCMLVMGKRLGLYDQEFLSFGPDEIGVNYHTLGEFLQLGLVQERPYGFSLGQISKVEDLYLANSKRTVSIRWTDEDSTLSIGMYALTNAGDEILRLFMDDECPVLVGYFEEVCKYWLQDGFAVVEGEP